MSLFSPAHDDFRTRVRRFVSERLTPNSDAWERQGGFPPTLFREMGQEGFLGLTQPKRYGGHELDFAYSVILAEELPRSKMMGLTLSVIAQTNFCPPLLNSFGTDSQKDLYLGPAILGEKIGALASTESGAGSDIVGGVECTAADAGDDWIVSGEKNYITNAPIADFVIVLARTRPERNPTSLSLIIVPSDTPGFRIVETLRKLGLHSSPTGRIEFDHCRISKALTLGRQHLGYFYLQNFLEERLLAGVIGVSVVSTILQETVRYIRQRQIFKGPMSELQVVRHQIVELVSELEMARRFVYSVCESYRDGHIEAKEICMIKFLVAELAQRASDRCLQLHGGYGFMEDNWLTRVYRDVRLLSIGGGASELMKDLVAGYLRL